MDNYIIVLLRYDIAFVKLFKFILKVYLVNVHIVKEIELFVLNKFKRK